MPDFLPSLGRANYEHQRLLKGRSSRSYEERNTGVLTFDNDVGYFPTTWPRPRSSSPPRSHASSHPSHENSSYDRPIHHAPQTPLPLPTPLPQSVPRISPAPLPAKRAAGATPADERRHKRAKTRLGLPLTLNAETGPATVLACADSGSERNVISLDLAQALGYDILRAPSEKKQFMLANGNTVDAVGEIVTECSFGIEATPTAAPMLCLFYVLTKLASPVIMGLEFLEQTKTLSQHRDRLIRVPRPANLPLQVYSMGRPRNQLFCYLEMFYVPAIPDTGSEVNLMTRRFALEKGLRIQSCREVLEFADGSLATTSGFVRAELAIRENNSTKFRKVPEVEFYVLDDVRHDLLVGEDSLEELDVFPSGQHSIFPAPLRMGPFELNRIRHLGAIDHVMLWIKKKIELRRNRPGLSTSNVISSNHSLADQRENNRRECELKRIANLPVDQQESEIAAEALRQAQYDDTAGTSHTS